MKSIITIEYCSNGKPISDFAYDDFLFQIKQDLKDNTHKHYRISTATPIYRIRAAIAEGEIPADRIVFKYYDDLFQANEHGKILNWPLGWCDIQGQLSERILRAAIKRSRVQAKETFDKIQPPGWMGDYGGPGCDPVDIG